MESGMWALAVVLCPGLACIGVVAVLGLAVNWFSKRP
jgi:hypothetical protein